jgi:hypothetical protein
VSVQPPDAFAASPTSTNRPFAMRSFDTTVRFASSVCILPLVRNSSRPPGHGCADTTAGISRMTDTAVDRRTLPYHRLSIGLSGSAVILRMAQWW